MASMNLETIEYLNKLADHYGTPWGAVQTYKGYADHPDDSIVRISNVADATSSACQVLMSIINASGNASLKASGVSAVANIIKIGEKMRTGQPVSSAEWVNTAAAVTALGSEGLLYLPAPQAKAFGVGLKFVAVCLNGASIIMDVPDYDAKQQLDSAARTTFEKYTGNIIVEAEGVVTWEEVIDGRTYQITAGPFEHEGDVGQTAGVQIRDAENTSVDGFVIQMGDNSSNGGFQSQNMVMRLNANLEVKEGSINYGVQSGDTLEDIAGQYGTTVENIMAYNPQILNANNIYAGESIYIPVTLNATPSAPVQNTFDFTFNPNLTSRLPGSSDPLLLESQVSQGTVFSGGGYSLLTNPTSLNFNTDIASGLSNANLSNGFRPGNENLTPQYLNLSPYENNILFPYLLGVDINSLAGQTFMSVDPLVLDLNGDGVKLTDYESSPVLFDADNDGGSLEQTGWVSPEDGLVVVDRNGNGKIDDISETLSEYYGGQAAAAPVGPSRTRTDLRRSRVLIPTGTTSSTASRCGWTSTMTARRASKCRQQLAKKLS